MYSEWGGGEEEKGIMQSGAVYATILATPIWDPSTHMRALRGRRDSFGPSDKSHMCEYDVPMSSIVSATSPHLCSSPFKNVDDRYVDIQLLPNVHRLDHPRMQILTREDRLGSM